MGTRQLKFFVESPVSPPMLSSSGSNLGSQPAARWNAARKEWVVPNQGSALMAMGLESGPARRFLPDKCEGELACRLLNCYASTDHSISRCFRAVKTGKDEVYNAVIDLMETEKCTFLRVDLQTMGKPFAHAFADAIWRINPFWDKFDASPKMPKALKPLFGFDAYSKSKVPGSGVEFKKSAPQLVVDLARSVSDDLVSAAEMLPAARTRFSQMREFLLTAATSCAAKADVMAKTLQRARNNQERTAPRSISDTSSLIVAEAVGSGVHIKNIYFDIQQALTEAAVYEAKDVDEFIPASEKWSRMQRHRFIENLNLRVPLELWEHTPGGRRRNIVFAWRIPAKAEERDPARSHALARKLEGEMPEYHTRAMKREYMQHATTLFGCKPKAFLRELYAYLTDDQCAAINAVTKLVDERVHNFLVDGDEDMLADLRALNGADTSAEMEPFWAEMELYFRENGVYDTTEERRHDATGGETSYMPFILSIRSLRRTVMKRLAAKFLVIAPDASDETRIEVLAANSMRVPHEKTIGYQFMPRRPGDASAARYSARFPIMNKVQIRALRKFCEDGHWCSTIIKYQRCWALRHREYVEVVCMDDKHKVSPLCVLVSFGPSSKAHVPGSLSYRWTWASRTCPSTRVCASARAPLLARTSSSWRGTTTFTKPASRRP
jgi:hypothetical protein